MAGFDIVTSRDAEATAQLWNQCQTADPLTADEVGRILDKDPGVVLATDTGVVAATAHDTKGYIRLLAVLPEAQHQGHGRALLCAAEDWLRAQGVTTIRWGGEIPYYLWPGLDQAWTAAVSLASSCGYTATGTAVNMTIPTTVEARPTLPIHSISEADPRIDAVRRFIQHNWAPWLTETDLAAAQGTLFVAFDGEQPVAFMAHSTLRRGWLGPMGTDPAYQGRGIGASVLQAACDDLVDRGFGTAQIAWVGPRDYFARFGATISRTFLGMVKTLNAPDPATPGS